MNHMLLWWWGKVPSFSLGILRGSSTPVPVPRTAQAISPASEQLKAPGIMDGLPAKKAAMSHAELLEYVSTLEARIASTGNCANWGNVVCKSLVVLSCSVTRQCWYDAQAGIFIFATRSWAVHSFHCEPWCFTIRASECIAAVARHEIISCWCACF